MFNKIRYEQVRPYYNETNEEKQINEFFKWITDKAEKDNMVSEREKYDLENAFIKLYEQFKKDNNGVRLYIKDKVFDSTQNKKIENYVNRNKRKYELLSEEDIYKTLYYVNDMIGWYKMTSVDVLDAVESIYNTYRKEFQNERDSLTVNITMDTDNYRYSVSK